MIKLIQQKNQYAGVARNNGFDAANGMYVMFLDADDYFEQSLVEKMVSVIHDRQADIAICRSIGYDEQVKREHELAGALNLGLLPEEDVFSKNDIPEHIFQLTAGWAWDKMYRVAFLREKKLRFQAIKAAEDELFVDLAFGEAEAIVTVKETLVTHRTNVVSSLEYRRDQLWYCSYEMLIAEKNELEKRGLFQMLERSFVNRAATYITWYACSITTSQFFSEFYSFFQKKAIKELKLLDYSLEYYYDSFAYETIIKINRFSEKEFLCERVRELNELVKRMEWMQRGKRWVLPDSFMLRGARVIIYGYGDVGKDWYEAIQKMKNVELVMVVDRNYSKFQGGVIDIHPVKDVTTVDYDYILIAIIDPNIVKAVKKSLIQLGVLPEKILWFDPVGQEKI